jgi:hypothetical protein
MARTINEIENEIINVKNKFTSLNSLNSTSTAAVWRNLVRVVANSIHTLESLIDVFREDIVELSGRAIPGTERWFVGKALEFQYDEVIPQILQVEDKITFQTVDESLRIITKASCNTIFNDTTNRSQVLVKLAKGDVSELEPLDDNELSASKSYFEKIKMAGQNLNIISLPPDKIKIEAIIYVDGQFIKTSVRDNVKNSIESYLKSTEFNGTIFFQKIVDAIQSVEGVRDVVIQRMEGKPDGGTYQRFTKEYNPLSGYSKITEESGDEFKNIVGLNVV